MIEPKGWLEGARCAAPYRQRSIECRDAYTGFKRTGVRRLGRRVVDLEAAVGAGDGATGCRNCGAAQNARVMLVRFPDPNFFVSDDSKSNGRTATTCEHADYTCARSRRGCGGA